jgi:hypothetical protein
VTAPEEIAAIEEALRCSEEATGAKLNIPKSHGRAVGSWDTTRTGMNIPYSTVGPWHSDSEYDGAVSGNPLDADYQHGETPGPGGVHP